MPEPDSHPEAAGFAVSIVSDPDALDALRAPWTELLAESESGSPFLTWEWMSTWWRIYGRGHLRIVLVRDPDGRLVGLAPLQVVWRRVLRLARWQAATFVGHGGDVTSEHLDVIVRRGFETVVADAVFDSLHDDPAIAQIDLQPFRADSLVLPRLQMRWSALPGVVKRTTVSWCPFVVLPKSRADFVASRSRNYRKKLGEYERRMAKGLNPTLRRARTPDDVHGDLDGLMRLHQARWGQASRAFRSEAYRRFHAAFASLMLEAGALRLFTLESEGQALAAIYCLQYGRRYYYYQAGREPARADARVGLVLMNRVLQEAIDDGATVFDFLSGREPYKYRWAADEFTNDRLAVWRSRRVHLQAELGRMVVRLRSIPRRLRRVMARAPAAVTGQRHRTDG